MPLADRHGGSSVLPLLIDRPVAAGSDGLRLLLPGRPSIALGTADDPVRAFNPGWRAESLFTLLDPLWLLVLRNESGAVACWFLDRSGTLSAPPDTHAPSARQGYANRLSTIGLWLRHAPGAPIQVAVPEAVRAWLALPRQIQEILDGLIESGRLLPLLPGPAILQRMSEPSPPLLALPTPGTASYMVGNPGAMMPLMIGDSRAVLHPGWRIARIEPAFSPLLTLVLDHEDGHRACWFLGLDGRVVSHSARLLPAIWLRHLLVALEPLFAEAWQHGVLGEAATSGPAAWAGSDILSPAEFSDLAALSIEADGPRLETLVWRLDAPDPPRGLAHVVATSTGLRGFAPAAISRSVSHGLHAEMDRLLRTGRMAWPSPVSGEMIESDGFALLLDQHCFAYRFRDEAVGLVFYVVCTGTHFHNHALYFPSADLLVARNGDLARACRGFFTHGRETLFRHIVGYRGAIEAGAARPLDPVVQQFFGACAIHIGHYVWQDLAGLAYLLRGTAGHGRLPHLHLFSMAAIQAYFGAEEAIFPVLDGRFSRHGHGFGEHVERFYRSNQRVIRYTAISVPAELGPAVVRAGDAAASLVEARADADAARARGRPVILFGIRVGNRTLDDLAEFGEALIAHLGTRFPGCTVVLDGLNDQHDRGDSVRQELMADSDLAQEFALADRFAAAGAGCGVHVVSGINRSALHSVVWCSRADCFVAPLGAALSKYRWICNTPGLVLCSAFNLEHRSDLRIYDVPAALEGSSEMHFNTASEVRDVESGGVTVGVDGRGNFVVDRPAVFARLDDLVRRYAGAA